jgi:hypothetical protein
MLSNNLRSLRLIKKEKMDIDYGEKVLKEILKLKNSFLISEHLSYS